MSTTLDIDDLDALLEAPFQNPENVYKEKPHQNQNHRTFHSPSSSERKNRYADDDYFRSTRSSHTSHSSSKREDRVGPTERHFKRRHSKSRSRSRSPIAKKEEYESRRRERTPSPELSEVDKDRRTVFVQQLAVRLRESELRDFFSKVGKVRQVKIVTDRITGRSKGFGYVEFRDEPSVPLAILLSGHKLLGIPILVSNTESEKNRLAEEAAALCSSRSASESARIILPKTTPVSSATASKKPPTPFRRLFISSIHLNVDEHMLTPIFEAYGRVENLSLLVDPISKRSKGAAIVTYRDPSAAKRALEQLDGVEIAGKAIKIAIASDAHMKALTDDSEATVSLSMTPQSRAELMMRLARDSDVAPAKGPFCLLLSNLYDPSHEADRSSTWKEELTDDIQEECSKFGSLSGRPIVLGSVQGEVLLQYLENSSTQLAVAALQGRWFGGRQIRASIISPTTFEQKLSSKR